MELSEDAGSEAFSESQKYIGVIMMGYKKKKWSVKVDLECGVRVFFQWG